MYHGSLSVVRARRSRRSPGRSAAWWSSSCRGRRDCWRRSSFSYSSVEQPHEQLAREQVAGLDAGLASSAVSDGVLVQPFPEDAEADLAGRHVFHQVQHVVVAEEVGRLERGRLQSLAEGVAVLQRHAQQIARAANRARRRLEQGEAVGVGLRVGERRKGSRRAGWPLRPSPTPAGRCAPSSSERPICRSRPRAARARRRRPPASCCWRRPASDPTGMLGSIPPCHSAN